MFFVTQSKSDGLWVLSMMYNDMPGNLVSICDCISRDCHFLM